MLCSKPAGTLAPASPCVVLKQSTGTEEVKWRTRWSIREFCGRAAVERDIGDVTFGWECARVQRQRMETEVRNQGGRNIVFCCEWWESRGSQVGTLLHHR